MELPYILLRIILGNILSYGAEGLRAEKIIGGDIPNENVKYVVAVLYDPQEIHMTQQNPCTGGIISDWYIATVAHCFYDKETGGLRNRLFYVGASIKDLRNVSMNTKYHRVHLLFIPRSYNSLTPDTYSEEGNLAVVKLAAKLGLHRGHRFLKKLRVARDQYIKADQAFIVSGYGWNEIGHITTRQNNILEEINGGTSDGKLRVAFADILNIWDCHHEMVGKPIAPGNMCVKIRQSSAQRKGICQGDSGAPLVRNDYLVGLAIHGFIECNENQLPGIYISVPFYHEFIDNVLIGNISSNMRIYKLVERIQSYPYIFQFEEILVV